MSELSLTELDAQHTELLPEREALGVHGSFNGAHIYVHQSNTQIQGFGVHGDQTAVNSISIGDTVSVEPMGR